MKNPIFTIDTWSKIASKPARTALEKQLPAYLPTCRWFGGKSRIIRSIRITDLIVLPLKEEAGALLIVEVSYNEGLDEYYQLPVSFIPEGLSTFLRSKYQQSVMFSVVINGEPGYLYDGMYCEAYRSYLFSLMAKKKSKEEGKGLVGQSIAAVKHFYKEHHKQVDSRVLSAEQSNTSVIYGKSFFFKIYRKLERMVNPDVEVTRFLSETAQFEHIPKYAGELTLKGDKSPDFMLGMMLELVENQGDAWEYMHDAIDRYYERVELGQQDHPVPALKGTFMKPIKYSKSPEILQSLIGGAPAERASLLGIRTAEMHIALASHPEPKTLDRSLFAALPTLTLLFPANPGAHHLPDAGPGDENPARPLCSCRPRGAGHEERGVATL